MKLKHTLKPPPRCKFNMSPETCLLKKHVIFQPSIFRCELLVSGGVNSKPSQIKLSAAPSVALAFVPGSHGKDRPTNPRSGYNKRNTLEVKDYYKNRPQFQMITYTIKQKTELWWRKHLLIILGDLDLREQWFHLILKCKKLHGEQQQLLGSLFTHTV